MATIEEINKKLAEKQDKREQELKELEKMRQERLTPFHLRIQLEHNKEMLRRVENQELEAMEITLKRHHPELRDHYKELFYEFWTLFLAGECKSIREYLYGEDFKDKAVRKLRKDIKVFGEYEQKN